MKIGYFLENYKKGGVDTFVKNLLRKNVYKDKIFLIYNIFFEYYLGQNKNIILGLDCAVKFLFFILRFTFSLSQRTHCH